MDWELTFMRWANDWWSCPFLDHTIPWLTYLGSHFAVILFILLSFFATRQKKIFRRLFLLYAIQSVIVYSLKFLILRERPFRFLQELSSKLSQGPGEILDPSFPSAHAALSFMMATVLSYWFPKYRLLFYLIALVIAWTRIYLGLHYPTDVFVGGLLGYGVSKGFFYYLRKKGIDVHPKK